MEELFDQECVVALKLGMTYEQYWEGEPQILLSFAKAHKQSVKDDMAKRDMLAWLIGSYVCTAVAVNLSSAFGKKGSKKQKYPSQPVYLNELDERLAAKQKEMQMKRSYDNFLAVIARNGFAQEKAAS